MSKPVFTASVLVGLLTLSAALFAGVATSRAADTQGQFAIDGIGAVRCDRFVEDAEARNRRLSEYGGWVTGYLTALNRFDGETFDVTPWQGTQYLILALVNYCRQNTEMPFHQAVAILGQSLKPSRIDTRSELVPVEQDGKRMLVYVEVVRRMQQQLKDQGFAIGVVDGQYGPNTAAAIKEFQVTQGLEPTGLPDQATLNQLFYAAAGGAN